MGCGVSKTDPPKQAEKVEVKAADGNTTAPPPTAAMSNGSSGPLVVFFDVSIGSEPAGRIEMTLRPDIVPKTAGQSVNNSTFLDRLHL
jgi:hypothetical protein